MKKLHNNVIIGILVVGLAIVGAASYFILDALPNTEHIPLYQYDTTIAEGTTYLMRDGAVETISPPPIIDGDTVYLPLSYVQETIDAYWFVDEAAQLVTHTTYTTVLKFTGENTTITRNDIEETTTTPLLWEHGECFIPSDLLTTFYPIAIEYAPTYDRVLLWDATQARDYAAITEHTSMRYEPHRHSPVFVDLFENDEVLSYEEVDDYTRVMNADGIYGYVLTEHLTAGRTTTTLPAIEPRPMPDAGAPIYVMWDLIGVLEGNNTDEKRVPTDGVTVMSPTWFSFDDELLDGTIVSIAHEDYVTWAHDTGYDVWALITDNFDSTVSHAILSDTTVRTNAIQNILYFIDAYDLDGINIDFENIQSEDAPFFIQFLRELAPLVRQRGAILSADTYVPAPYNLYYNRTEIANAVDYLLIMGYDEHYAGSPVAGPVASFDFVEKGIYDTLQEAPAEQVLLGMPFYTRVWREEHVGDTIEVSSRALGMNYARQTFLDAGAEFLWDPITKYDYAEYEAVEDGVTVRYRTWLENEKSIAEKLSLYEKYNLAGVAAWSRGLQSEAVDTLIAETLR